MKKYAFIVLLSWCLLLPVWSKQQTIVPLMDQLQQSTCDSLKHALNEQTKAALMNYLRANNAMKAPIDSIPYTGSVYDADSTLRIISWNYALQDGSYGCNALLIKSQRHKAPLLHAFSTQKAQLPNEKKRYTSKNWYGALYYRIIKQKNRYLLLGYSTYCPTTRVKLIEVLRYEKNKPYWGEKIFDIGKQQPYRVVFEYSSRVQMLLHYDAMQEGFIFDHLSPEEPSMKGIKAYYGPDFSYDGLFYCKKKWTLQEDLNVKNAE